jgi:uncharacterized protein (DUF2126 family)
VEDGLRRPDEGFDREVSAAVLALGPEEFRQRILREHEGLVGHRAKREDVSLRHVRVIERAEKVLAEVCAGLGVDVAEVRRRRRDGMRRAIAALALTRRCRLTERAAAAQLGMGSGSAVSYLIRRVKQRAQTDRATARLVETLTRPHP